MKRALLFCSGIGLAIGLASLGTAATTTMTGKISDSKCGASHAKMTANGKMTDHDCALACVKAGAKYVFVSSDGKVYDIANQTESGLSKYAGEEAKVTADFSGSTITVAKVAAAK